MTRWSAIGCALLWACSGDGGAVERPPDERPRPAEAWSEEAAALGVDFRHQSGARGDFHFPEINGAGGALADLDGDGDLDLYLVDSGRFDENGALVAGRDRLYLNRLEEGSLRFDDVTETSGVVPRGYGMGVATGDVDGDGLLDLYRTAYGPDQLFRNLGGGRFRDVTAEAMEINRRWSSSAAFLDVDRDGRLDLYVANYVRFDPATQPRCRNLLGGPDYCGPLGFAPEPDVLYRNRGDGTFEDVSLTAGVGRAPANGLGVLAADLDGDGWSDLYVANDQQPNHLWRNRGDGTFEEAALAAGLAVNREGEAEASMGIASGDVDRDGDLDLFLTHLEGETHTLYRNDGGGFFTDVTLELGLAAPSRAATGFGAAFLDADLDGRLDLLVANGAVTATDALLQAGDPWPYHEPNQLFLGGDGGFVEAAAGAALALSEVSRGLALGDVDNDGDADALVLNNRGPARLLLNRGGDGRQWLGLRLADAEGRDLPGARAELRRPGRPLLVRHATTGGSYASASDPRVLFGLGGAPGDGGLGDGPHSELAVDVTWPDGRRERFSGLAPDRYHELHQGAGEALE